LIQKGELDEALSEKKLLVEIDPQDPQNFCLLGQCLYYLHRYDDSIIAYNKALELDPNHGNTLFWIIFCLLARRENDKALEMVKRIEPIERYDYNYFLGFMEAIKGNKVDAEKQLESLTPSIKTLPWPAAIFYASIGNRDKTVEYLTKLYNENRFAMSFVFLTHFFDKYRTDREFVDLLKKSGFEFRQSP
jgi:tetratricopeptide (TPR) repeat protein